MSAMSRSTSASSVAAILIRLPGKIPKPSPSGQPLDRFPS